MKVWKVQETIANDDKALELELNRLEYTGAKIKEVMLARTIDTLRPITMYVYKIIYTVEDIIEEEDESK